MDKDKFIEDNYEDILDAYNREMAANAEISVEDFIAEDNPIDEEVFNIVVNSMIEDSNVTESKKVTESTENTSNPYINLISKKMWEVLNEKGIKPEQLIGEGTIYYKNGNDGTDFDWQCNNHTCEFMMFYKSSEMGCIKITIEKDDSIWGCFWGDEGAAEGESFSEPTGIGYPEDFVSLCYEQADELGKYDLPISEINWDADVKGGHYWLYDDEDEEDWYDEEYGDEEMY